MNLATTPVPHFTIRWTEPLSGLRTRVQSLDVNVSGESGASPVGHVTARTEDNLGPIPAGGARAETRILRGPEAMTAVEAIWKQVKRDRVEQWIPQAAPDVGRMDRDDIELVVHRGANDVQTFRTDLDDAAQPVKDLLAAAAKLHTDIRLHPAG
jgi:hypothetical protein